MLLAAGSAIPADCYVNEVHSEPQYLWRQLETSLLLKILLEACSFR